MRVGFGYDIHRLAKGRRLILGGVPIPFKLGLLGHSDADVLCHAIADSLLGAVAAGDIGTHFPNTDKRFKDISSLLLLKTVAAILKKQDYRIANIDSMIIAESPKLAPYIEKMRANIAGSLGIKTGQVSIKATTNEGLGDIGRGNGICAFANALVERIK
ncbi:MAG: 2-C-methyl-D-erythritol 2,4-cyclodiphosphate synthase [Candidatus Edwardsbacteria bacterium]|nr:2-C-methyl-D-erythritol 2,4-cyclodiphosphate synthase [Candidatus Edwardsbacteria bacterium]